MQYMADWMYGFVPPQWWPDRPREPQFYGVSLLPLAAGASTTVEMVFDKRHDILVWGGCVLVGNTTGTLIDCPASGTFTSILCRLKNPAGNVVFSSGTIVGTGNEPGFVPLENIFSAWQFLALRAAIWPLPIPIPTGGSLKMDLINMNGAANKNTRFTFFTSIMYEEREFVA
jgi:hypothetical protein